MNKNKKKLKRRLNRKMITLFKNSDAKKLENNPILKKFLRFEYTCFGVSPRRIKKIKLLVALLKK
ncbi:MAG: hypothetical protein ACRCY7_03135 [Cetobacterium sp.]|uniref:hypothetical protein n=1 Tax=Cetobacterium sp. TaxID=2071632 RepID=UPI003F2D3A4B